MSLADVSGDVVNRFVVTKDDVSPLVVTRSVVTALEVTKLDVISLVVTLPEVEGVATVTRHPPKGASGVETLT